MTSTRDRLFDAARQLMADDGFGINMNAVAERAGVTRMTLYRHFGTKQDLILELTLDKAGELAVAIGRVLEDDSRPHHERLVDTLVLFGSEIQATPFLSALFERSSFTDFDGLDPEGRIFRLLWDLYLPFLEDAEAANVLRKPPADSFMWALLQMLASLVPLANIEPTPERRRRMFEDFLTPSLFRE